MKSDSSTVIATINNYGSIKQLLLDVTEEIFECAQESEVELSNEYILGSLSVIADLASLTSEFNKKWRVLPTPLSDICRIYGKPPIDLFATHINTQLPL